MPRRGRRIRIAKSIYRDASGVAAVITIRGHREEIRFPPDTPLLEIERDVAKRTRELDELLPDAPLRGTLAAVVDSYLKRVPEAERTNRRALLAPWVEAAGDRPFFKLSRSDLQGIANAWRATGLSANRASKRISALRVAWDTIAPDSALPHAIFKVKRYGEPPAATRGLPIALVERILAAVEDTRSTKRDAPTEASKSKARLRVLAWTGQPPARVMAIQPGHVKWHTTPPQLYVSPRRKGTGAADAWLPLLPQAVDALKDFFAVQATGPFTLSPLGRTLKRAVRKIQSALRNEGADAEADRLNGFRVYDLRHTLLTALADETDDIYAVAEYAGHANLQTTRRYMKAA